MMRTAASRAGIVYFIAHFAVEAACFFWLFSRFGGSEIWWMVSLTYDAFAFLPQGIIGAWMDRHPTVPFGCIGLLLILTALWIPNALLSGFFLTLGNCMVHVAGAQATLRNAAGKMGPSGIFVSGGSFGVVTGQLLGSFGKPVWIPFVIVAAAFVLLCAFWRGEQKKERLAGPMRFACAAEHSYEAIVLLSFLTVAFRSYVGYAIPISWKKTVFQTILLFFFMGVGKGLGGIAADRFGAKRTAVGSLLLSLPFLVLGNNAMIVSLIGVALFSMTMPISLGVLASVMPDHPGEAFGVTTTALFFGTLPVFFVRPHSLLSHVILVILLCGVAAGCFFHISSDKNVCTLQEDKK